MSSGYQAFEGVSWRPLQAADLHGVFEIEAASEAFDDGAVEVSESDLQGDWDRPDFDPERMSLGGLVDGRLVAYVQVFQGRAEGAVHPDYRGRGLGEHLARWTWEVARSEGRERVGQTISDNERSAATLFGSLGYERGHTAWILRRDISAPLPAPVLPAGYRFREYVPGADDRSVYDLIDRAFSEWRNADSEPMGFENWLSCTLRDVRADFVVLLEYEPPAVGGAAGGAAQRAPASGASVPAPGAHLVGTLVGHDYDEEDEGWIEQVAVQRDHRGKGLGGALLAESFRRFREAGRGVGGVSTDSRTGALGLYEHAGMKVVRSYTRWVKTGL